MGHGPALFAVSTHASAYLSKVAGEPAITNSGWKARRAQDKFVSKEAINLEMLETFAFEQVRDNYPLRHFVISLTV
jgi:hypothetical protein